VALLAFVGPADRGGPLRILFLSAEAEPPLLRIQHIQPNNDSAPSPPVIPNPHTLRVRDLLFHSIEPTPNAKKATQRWPS